MHPDEEKIQSDLVPGLSEGRIVHYVLESGRSKGEHRPAIVVRDHKESTGSVNLQVFTDSSNDFSDVGTLPLWRTSVCQDEQIKTPGTWHFPERV